MINIQNRDYCPSLEEIADYVNNTVFIEFCQNMKNRYNCSEKIEFSSCTWERGWNVKFRKAGKNLCTIYLREGFFTVLIVIGKKEKESVEAVLPKITTALQQIYYQTPEENGQRWLMIDLEDKDNVYMDVFRLLDIRRGMKTSAL